MPYEMICNIVHFSLRRLLKKTISFEEKFCCKNGLETDFWGIGQKGFPPSRE